MNVERPAEESFDDCEHVLKRVYEFLDNEIDAASGDAIRHHLAMCEPCLERFDVEEAVKSLVHRCCGGEVAPSHLRAKIVTQLTVLRRTI
ncbi:MAG TPA: mycothiol system anti-sigma-R factor [Propionibacteriaceae bacterium]|jgi:mycothiol system anti-sigma-R factor|nr:mycothiol system anti-sigma-R factor [Propionibacteriaceae bacterium]HMI34974.1 mycothiol system anti-sigma-R factor [Propionibacteriaceae bacterium]